MEHVFVILLLDLLIITEKQKLRRPFRLLILPVAKEYPPQSAVRVDLYALAFYIVGTVGSLDEVGDIEIYHIPSIVKLQGHGCNERFHFC